MEDWEFLQSVIAREDPVLAKRIYWLLWSYERSRLRHSVQHDQLTIVKSDGTARPQVAVGPA